MALKAYKHLTDGDVKIVEESSAEEASILGDVVRGATYGQLQNDGSQREVAAAQGSALWVDVTNELGGGSVFAHLSEDTGASMIFSDWEINVQAAPFDYSGDYAGITPALVYAENDTVGGYTQITSAGYLVSRGPGSDPARLRSVWSDTQAVPVWEVDAAGYSGVGLLLHSPDGTKTKILRLSDAGAVELVVL